MRLLVYNWSTVESTIVLFFHFPAFILEYFDLFKFLNTGQSGHCLTQNLASSDKTENVYLQNKSQQGALLQKRLMFSKIHSCLNNAHPVLTQD